LASDGFVVIGFPLVQLKPFVRHCGRLSDAHQEDSGRPWAARKSR